MSDLTTVFRRPILFSGAMVRAILEGRKTQTRRVIKPEWSRCLDLDDEADRAKAVAQCPYGLPGGRLWVRETWAASLDSDGDMQEPIIYRATYDESLYGPLAPRFDARATEIWDTVGNTGWRPSIHMPRAYSRITLEIASVRVERVQDISEADAQREGWDFSNVDPYTTYDPVRQSKAREWFAALWDGINDARGYGWQANPWVWVVEFGRIKP